MIPIMCYKVGTQLWSIRALGFMLPATTTTALSECRCTSFCTMQIHLYYISDWTFMCTFQWSWKCCTVWYFGATTRPAQKLAVLVSYFLLPSFTTMYMPYLLVATMAEAFLSVLIFNLGKNISYTNALKRTSCFEMLVSFTTIANVVVM